MPDQEPRQNSQQPVEAQVIPMDDPAAAASPPVITADSPGVPAQQGQGTQATDGQSGEEYWKKIALDNREAAQKFAEYSPLITHLEGNPEHVDVLQKATEGHAIGIVAADRMAQEAQTQRTPSQEEQLAAELGFVPSTDVQATPAQQAPETHTMSNQEAMRHGEQRAIARMEFQRFREDVTGKGVPDHAIDEFVQYLRNPNGLTYSDLFVAFQSAKERIGEQPAQAQAPTSGVHQGQPQAQAQVVGAPISVTSLPAGESNRPESNVYTAEGDGSKFVQDPSNI